MPVISPPIAVKSDRPRTGQGGRGMLPPAYGGGGDNGPGDGSNDYGRRLNRARLTLVLALTSISVLFVTFTVIFVSTVVVATRMPNIYRSETVILVDPQKVPDSFVPSTVTTSIQDRLSTIQQQVMSPSRLKRIIDSLGLYPNLRGRVSDQQLIAMMQKSTVVEVANPGDRRLSSFKIAFHSKDPVTASRVANQLAALFIEENVKARGRQATGTTEFLKVQLGETKTRLDGLEQRVSGFKRRHMGELPQQMDANLTTLEHLHAQLRQNADSQTRAAERRQVMRE